MEKRPNTQQPIGTRDDAKQSEPQQQSNETAKTAGKRPFSKPVLKKFRQIDYVATYGSE